MKYYYNGRLVRTSAHDYTHAVIDDETGKVLGCRANRAGAESIKSAAINERFRGLENTTRLLKAIRAGKSCYKVTEGRRSYYERVTAEDTEESCLEYFGWLTEKIEHIRAHWQIVELEKRQ